MRWSHQHTRRLRSCQNRPDLGLTRKRGDIRGRQTHIAGRYSGGPSRNLSPEYGHDVRVTTDLGDLGNLPIRFRLALASVVLGAILIGLGAVTGWLSLQAAVLLLLNGGVALQWVFTRRRPWWRDEPGEDIIDRDFSFRLVSALVLDGSFIVAVVATRTISLWAAGASSRPRWVDQMSLAHSFATMVDTPGI